LKESFKSLSIELLQLIDCSSEAKTNYSALAENFAVFSNLKGAHIDQLAVLSKDISQTFQQASVVKQTELDQ